MTSSVRNISKCITIHPSRTDQYKHSFFVQTEHWNHMDENTVSAEKLKKFKSALAVLSIRHFIAQEGSYDVTLQIQIQRKHYTILELYSTKDNDKIKKKYL